VVHAARNISWNLFYSARNKFVAEKYKSFWVAAVAAATDADKTNNLLLAKEAAAAVQTMCVVLNYGAKHKIVFEYVRRANVTRISCWDAGEQTLRTPAPSNL
jgi:hypothetical protein